jgi:CHAD domain-containing protein
VATAQEVEVKLTAPGELGPLRLHAAIAAARGVGSVGAPTVSELDATYYDTAELGLANAMVTLRRREGGADAGWHLTPPAALAILVGAFARGRPLVPVARIRTTRTAVDVFGPDQELLAEVADDDVRSESYGSKALLSAWREIEVELKGTAPRKTLQVLTDALIAAGARRSVDVSKLRRALGGRLSQPVSTGDRTGKKPTGQDVIAGYLSDQVTALLRADPAVRADLPDSVHSARVAIRRFRSALRVFATLLPVEPPADLDERLSGLSAVFGRARDAEVQRGRLEAALRELPAELVLGPVAARILEDTVPGVIEARRVLLETLQTGSYYDLLDELLRYTAENRDRGAATRPGGSGAHKQRSAAGDLLPPLRAARRLLVHRADAAIAGGGDLELHGARKAAKRLRYAAESVQPVFGPKAAALAASAEKVQEILGEHQDSVVMRDRLRALAVSTQTAANESAFTFGLLYGLQVGHAEESLRNFEKTWRRLSLQRRWPS